MDIEGPRLRSHVRPIRIAGFTRLQRGEAIALISDAINSYGGFILDSHMYSNSMLAISFEIRASNISSLVQTLVLAGLSMSLETGSDASDLGAPRDGPDLIVPGSMNVNFIHDDPPLRIEVPAVPG